MNKLSREDFVTLYMAYQSQKKKAAQKRAHNDKQLMQGYTMDNRFKIAKHCKKFQVSR